MAADLGVDRIFGRGTTPGEVASYLVHALLPTQPSALGRTARSAPEPRGSVPA
jgi:beta-lysine 5,6-aminomutase beta subunit